MTSSLGSARGSMSPSKRGSAKGSITSFDDSLSESPGGQEWMGDTNNCTICSAKLGKRVMNPRHHCRLCGRCVCSKCSPSTAQLEGSEEPQRVCKTCVSGAFEDARAGLRAKARLEEIAEQMWQVAGTDICEFDAEDVDEAVTACAHATDGIERKMLEVRGLLSKTEVRASDAEAELAEVRLAKSQLDKALVACQAELIEAEVTGVRERAAREGLEETVLQCRAALAEAETRAKAAEAAAAASPTAKFFAKPFAKPAEKIEAHPSQANTSASEGDSLLVSAKPSSSMNDPPNLGQSLPPPQQPPQPVGARAGKCASACVTM